MRYTKRSCKEGISVTPKIWSDFIFPHPSIPVTLPTQLFCYTGFTVSLPSIFTPFLIFLNMFALLKTLHLAFFFFPCRGWGCVWPWIACHCSKLPHRGSSLFSQVWAQDLWFGKAALEGLMQHSVIPCSHRGLWLAQASAVFYTHTHNVIWGGHFENTEFHSPPQGNWGGHRYFCSSLQWQGQQEFSNAQWKQ